MWKIVWAGLLGWLGTNAAAAAETTIRNAHIEWISAIGGQPGQCAFKLDRAIARSGDRVVDCSGQTVAFECADPGSPTLDLAMLALDSCRPVDVRVSDTASIHNACVATQVWVKRRSPSRYYRYDEYEYDEGCRTQLRYDDDRDRWGDDDDDDDDDDDPWDDD